MYGVCCVISCVHSSGKQSNSSMRLSKIISIVILLMCYCRGEEKRKIFLRQVYIYFPVFKELFIASTKHKLRANIAIMCWSEFNKWDISMNGMVFGIYLWLVI